MSAIRRILVAVKDPEARSLPALEKAARLATACKARLILFHAITDLVSVDLFLLAPDEVKRLKRDTMARYQRRLEVLADRLRDRDIAVSVCAAWDYPPHEAIVRHAHKHAADLIVADCHGGRRFAPWLLHLTDWELLRTSPVPVLLVKSAASWDDLQVLAAVDPAHRFAKPAKLDARILSTAGYFTHALGGKLHVAHSYIALPAGSVPMGGASGLSVQQIVAGAEARARANLERALADTRVPRGRQHLIQGAPVETIPALAKQLGSKLVVMGAISRSGLKRLLIGNTAERVLNALDADVLVVKPNRFKTPVTKRGRGMHFVGAPAIGISV
jgi:universal stress protein E